MTLEGLGQLRRAVSVALALSAVALVGARTTGDAARSSSGVVSAVAGGCFVLGLALFAVVWRKEHAARALAAAARERQQLERFKLEAQAEARRRDQPAR